MSTGEEYGRQSGKPLTIFALRLFHLVEWHLQQIPNHCRKGHLILSGVLRDRDCWRLAAKSTGPGPRATRVEELLRLPRFGQPVPRFREKVVPLLEADRPGFVHPVPAADDSTRDQTAPHGVLVTNEMRRLYRYVCWAFSDPCVICVDGPPFAGKSQSLKVIAAALKELHPGQAIIYERSTPPTALDALLVHPPPFGAFLVLDQEKPSSFDDILTLADLHHLHVLVATASAWPRITDSASGQIDLYNFHHVLDGGTEAFGFYLRAFPTCLSDDDLRQLHAFLGGSLCAAMWLLGHRKLPRDEDVRWPEGPITIPPVLAPFPLAERVLAYLVGHMRSRMDKSPYFFYLADLFLSAKKTDRIRVDESTDLRWFLYAPESRCRIASPLYRHALEFACRLAPLQRPFNAIPPWALRIPAVMDFYHKRLRLESQKSGSCG
ncbi:hypothetical protein PAPYR_1568 [Paratrimastix pyriformis]|uniref:Uncharacterized protein n=1 Tax=Paratrimastix pyriformis TaxID=342808 RepID=A0ABQ8UU52_9EUKA|nr:hypothetical protein PAPYR_1568 [Paratrimastix pyriformis]